MDVSSVLSKTKEKLLFLAWTLAIFVLLDVAAFVVLVGNVETTPFRYVGF